MFPLYIPISISFTKRRSTRHHHLLETPSSPRKEPTRRRPHINLHATITETNTTFPPPRRFNAKQEGQQPPATFHHHPSPTTAHTRLVDFLGGCGRETDWRPLRILFCFMIILV
ncbi:hypothetical protein Dimus_033926 [Dionaea muscipula]